MRPLILFAALTACMLFAAPAPARAECAGGFCGLLPGAPVARLASAVRNREFRPVARLVAARPLRSVFANRPVRGALRGMGSLFCR
jgi:hypothetical protein